METKSIPDLLDLKSFLEEECFDLNELPTTQFPNLKSEKDVDSETIYSPVDTILNGKRPLIQLSEGILPTLNQSL